MVDYKCVIKKIDRDLSISYVCGIYKTKASSVNVMSSKDVELALNFHNSQQAVKIAIMYQEITSRDVIQCLEYSYHPNKTLHNLHY